MALPCGSRGRAQALDGEPWGTVVGVAVLGASRLRHDQSSSHDALKREEKCQTNLLMGQKG
jgi:hypothetical protein